MSFVILGTINIIISEVGEVEAFQILKKTKYALFELPRGTHIQRISETEFIIAEDL